VAKRKKNFLVTAHLDFVALTLNVLLGASAAVAGVGPIVYPIGVDHGRMIYNE
jgi:hypothetical protein